MSHPIKAIDTPANNVSFWYQICTIGLSALILSWTVYSALMTPTPLEDFKYFEQVSMNRTRQQAVEPVEVLTGLTISRYRLFDMPRNQFIFEGVIWFQYDPALLSLDTISQFHIDRADIKRLGDPRAEMVDGKLLVRFDVLVNVSLPLDYAHFPLDDHRLSMVMTNNRLSATDVVFVAKSQNFRVEASALGFGWRWLEQRVVPGTVTKTVITSARELKNTQPATQFIVGYGRAGVRYVMVLLLPMFVLIIIMLSTFSYDSRQYFTSMIATNGAALSGLIGFRFVIEAMSPAVGYFMISDVYFMTFLCVGALIFLLSIFSGSFTRTFRYAILTFVHVVMDLVFVGVMLNVLSYA